MKHYVDLEQEKSGIEQLNEHSNKAKQPPFQKLTLFISKTFIGRKYDDIKKYSVQKMESFDSGLTKRKRIIYYGTFLLTCLIIFIATAYWSYSHPKIIKTKKIPIAKSNNDTVLNAQIQEMSDSIKAHREITIEDKQDADNIKRLAEAASASFKDLPDSLKK